MPPPGRRHKPRDDVAKQAGRTVRASLSTRRGHPAAGHAPGRVRIVGGSWKRTPIEVADLAGLRPTPDRVRETVFNWLAHLRPDLATVRGLDLFAGTGALGFELASRGAGSVLMVERDAGLVARLTALKQRLAAEHVQVLAGDAFSVVDRLPGGTFDIVFLDPPFDAGVLVAAIARARTLLAADGLVYAESDSPIGADQARNLGFELVRSGKAGRVRFHLLRKDGS